MTFDRIYRENRWNGEESRSGPGSGRIAALRLGTSIAFLVERLRVETVADVACGDAWWIPELPRYLGLDVSAEAIARAKANHPGWEFRVNDIREHCPRAGLILFRDALQHMTLDDGQRALATIARSGSTWLLASTYIGGENVPIAEGDTYSPDLEAPPFEFSPPVLLIPDGFTYHDPGQIRDGRKMLGLWSLAG